MVKGLAYFFAIIITVCLAVVLYPIAGLFWLLGLFGKIADAMFRMTRRIIGSIWADLKNMDKENRKYNMPTQQYTVPPQNYIVSDATDAQWICSQCGNESHGKFCTKCGTPRRY